METLLAYIASLTDDPTSMRVMVIVLASVTVFVFGLGISYLLVSASDPVRRRLRAAREGGFSDSDHTQDEFSRFVKIDTIFGPVSKYLVPSEELERSATTKRLVHAGFRSPSALSNFYSAKAILAILLPMLVMLVSSWFPDVNNNTIMMYTLSAAYAGFIAPSYYVDHHLSKRQRALRNGFPDALDLMVVCVESGLGLSQAIQRVSEELAVSHPELATELALVNAEIRVGVESTVALRNFAERTGLEDIRGLVSLLVQTIRFGTGIADALRVYAEEFRDKRMQAAEEAAAKMGTKMIFPLVFFMFPGFFVVAVGPAAIKLIAAFSSL
jgi:tight adherence protein C